MGNSTGSMFYMAAALIAVYLAGMLCFAGYRFMKRKWEARRDRRFRSGEE